MQLTDNDDETDNDGDDGQTEYDAEFTGVFPPSAQWETVLSKKAKRRARHISSSSSSGMYSFQTKR